jgi:hypothetical protein
VSRPLVVAHSLAMARGAAFDNYDYTVLVDHVAGYPPTGTGWVSTFNAALREARTLTARELDTGKLTGEQTTTLWAGTVIYLVLLEQIGMSLRPLRKRQLKSKPREQAIERAARWFGPHTTIRQRRMLYALRCAFAHEYGLYNTNRSNPDYQIVFALDDDPSGPLVKWPQKRWNGVSADATGSNSTHVWLVAVGDLVEDVVTCVRTHAMRGTLRSQLPINDLRERYGFQIRPE